MFISIGWLILAFLIAFALGALAPILFIIRRVSRTGSIHNRD